MLVAKERMMKDRPHDEAMAELFREDPVFAALFLDEILRDGDQADLVIAIRQIQKVTQTAANAKIQ